MLARSLDNIVAVTGMPKQQALDTLLQANPQGRLIQPREVAAAVMWLCHPDSGAVTGQAVAVAGGET
jgi:NAD(P)-dependent dehydrogenase (short-subunit alcohol dehydrogenase family)